MAGRERSPNYPGHGLEAAIRFVKALYDKEKRSALPLESVAIALGSEGLTGPSRSKIAAMRQFGLIESVTEGRVRVSDLALAIIHKPDEEQYKAAIQASAIRPSLFLDLRTEYRDASDETIRFHLIKDRQFSEDGANRAIKTFRETMAFADLDSPNIADGALAVVPRANTQGLSIGESKSIGMVDVTAPRALSRIATFPYAFAVSNDLDAQVQFIGARRPNESDVNALIAYLEIFRARIADEPRTVNKEESGSD